MRWIAKRRDELRGGVLSGAEQRRAERSGDEMSGVAMSWVGSSQSSRARSLRFVDIQVPPIFFAPGTMPASNK